MLVAYFPSPLSLSPALESVTFWEIDNHGAKYRWPTTIPRCADSLVHTVPTVFEAVSRPPRPEVRSDDSEFGVRSPR